VAKVEAGKAIPEVRPHWSYWESRGSFRRTDADREAHYLAWLNIKGHQDDGGRRALFMRRFTKPEPPTSVPVRSLAEIRGDHRRWTPAAPTQIKEVA
jgi:hypothetical protein